MSQKVWETRDRTSLSYGRRGGLVIYATNKARACAVARFMKLGFNYFTGYPDVQGFGLSFTTAVWVAPGCVYRKDC